VRGTGFEPEEEMLAHVRSLCVPSGGQILPDLHSPLTNCSRRSARDRIWTGGPLRDSVL